MNKQELIEKLQRELPENENIEVEVDWPEVGSKTVPIEALIFRSSPEPVRQMTYEVRHEGRLLGWLDAPANLAVGSTYDVNIAVTGLIVPVSFLVQEDWVLSADLIAGEALAFV